MYFQHVAVSGELGSGKTTLVEALRSHLQLEIVSTGSLQRQVADERGMSTLELNRKAETDESIDDQIDSVSKVLGQSDVPLLFDSRMAWHFVPTAFKIHLIVDPVIGAERLLNRASSSSEQYSSAEEARELAEQRYSSEVGRFREKYNVDVVSLRNYDLVVDTSDAPPDQVKDTVLRVLSGESSAGGSVYVSPRRVLPTIDPVRELANVESSPELQWDEPVVGYSRPYFFGLRGHDALSRAIRDGQLLTKAFLEVEGTEIVVAGISADSYVAAESRRAWVYDWEDIHGFRFSAYPVWPESI